MKLSTIKRFGSIGLVIFAFATAGAFYTEYSDQAEMTAVAEGIVAQKLVGTQRLPGNPQRAVSNLATYVVDFETAAGQPVRFSTKGLPFIELDEGERRPVRYKPENPEQALVDVWFTVYPLTSVMGGFLLIASMLFMTNVMVILPRLMSKSK